MLDDFMYMYTKDPYAVFIDHCAFVDKDPPRETVQTNDDLWATVLPGSMKPEGNSAYDPRNCIYIHIYILYN